MPVFVPMQSLWKGRGGWGGSSRLGTAPWWRLVARRGQLPAQPGRRTDLEEDIENAPDAKGGNAIVDETEGDILYVNPAAGWLFRSRDDCATGCVKIIQVRPDGFGLIPKNRGRGGHAMRHHAGLRYDHGRLIMPARIMGPKSFE